MKVQMSDKNQPQEELLHCGFCQRSHLEVRAMIAGPAAFICDECVVQCVGVLQEDYPAAIRFGLKSTPDKKPKRSRRRKPPANSIDPRSPSSD